MGPLLRYRPLVVAVLLLATVAGVLALMAARAPETAPAAKPVDPSSYTEDPRSAPLGVMTSPKGRIEVVEPLPDTSVPGNPLRIAGTFDGETQEVLLEIYDAADQSKRLHRQVIKPKREPFRSIFSTAIAWSTAQEIEVRLSVLDEQAKTEHVRFKVKVVEPLTPLIRHTSAPTPSPGR